MVTPMCFQLTYEGLLDEVSIGCWLAIFLSLCMNLCINYYVWFSVFAGHDFLAFKCDCCLWIWSCAHCIVLILFFLMYFHVNFIVTRSPNAFPTETALLGHPFLKQFPSFLDSPSIFHYCFNWSCILLKLNELSIDKVCVGKGFLCLNFNCFSKVRFLFLSAYD